MQQVVDRVEQLESKVCMYEASNSQPTRNQAANMETVGEDQVKSIVEARVSEAIAALDKKIAAIVGATHKSSQRYTVNGLANKLLYNSRRVKDMESLQGNTNMCKTVRKLAAMPPPPPTSNQDDQEDAESLPPSPRATQADDQPPSQETIAADT